MATGLSNASGLAATGASLILRALNSGLSQSSSLPGSTEAGAWESAVIANGGTLSPARKAIVQSFIAAEIAAGTWPLTDDYWAAWAENEPQALTSLKQKRLATAVAAPVFVVDRGYTGTATAYINTNYVCSTMKVAMTTTSARLAVYERTLLQTFTAAMGVSASGNLLVIPKDNSSKVTVHTLTTGNYQTVAVVPTSLGWTAGSGVAGPSQSVYKNGVLFESGTVAMGANLPTAPIFICCRNVGGAPNMPRATQIGFAVVGAALSPAQELAQFNNVQAWAAAVGAASDVDALAWGAAVVTNGGTVSADRFDLISSMVATWKAAGIWNLIDDCWLLVAENAPQALTSLKQLRLATATASPTFTVDRGYAFNGTTQYLDTGFIPGTHKVAMTGTSLHISVYERTNLASTSFAAGAYTNATSSLLVGPRRAAGQMDVSLNGLSAGPGGAVLADSRGLSAGSRNGTLITDVLAYRNGVAVEPYAVPAVGSTLSAAKLYIGCFSSSNTAASFRASTLGFVSVGAAIPAAQQPAFYNALQIFMTAVGANV